MYNSSILKVKRLYRIFFLLFLSLSDLHQLCSRVSIWRGVLNGGSKMYGVHTYIYIYRRIDQIHYSKVGVALFLPLLTNKKWFPFPPPLPKAKELCRIKKKTDTHSHPFCPLPFARYPAGCPK